MAVKSRSASRKAKRVSKKVVKRRRVSKRKAMRRARKVKRVSRVSQIGTKRKVWNGTKKYTAGGLTKSDLCLNRVGKVVSKKQHAMGKKAKYIVKWAKAVLKARKKLGITGMVYINRGDKGIALYKEAKAIYQKRK